MEKHLQLHRFQKKHEIKLLDRAMGMCAHLQRDLQTSLDLVVQLRERHCDRSDHDFNRLCVEIISGQTSLRMDGSISRTSERFSLDSARPSLGRSFSPDSGFDSAYDPSERGEEPVEGELICSTPKRVKRVESSRLSLDSSAIEGHRTPKQIKERGNYFTTTAMKIERELSACVKSLEFKFEKHDIRKKQ